MEKMLIYDKGQIQNFSISADLIFADDKLLLGLVGWLRQSLQYLTHVHSGMYYTNTEQQNCGKSLPAKFAALGHIASILEHNIEPL